MKLSNTCPDHGSFYDTINHAPSMGPKKWAALEIIIIIIILKRLHGLQSIPYPWYTIPIYIIMADLCCTGKKDKSGLTKKKLMRRKAIPSTSYLVNSSSCHKLCAGLNPSWNNCVHPAVLCSMCLSVLRHSIIPPQVSEVS